MKRAKSLWKDFIFLVRPFWKHGKLLVILTFFSSIVAVPLGLLAGVSVAQAVIDRILAGSTVLDVLGVIGVYFLVYALSTLLQQGVDLFYNSWKKEAISLEIKRDLFQQALRTDYRWLDDPAYFQQLNMVLANLPSRSVNTLSSAAQMIGAVAGSIVMVSVIAKTGPILALIVLAFVILSMLLQAKMVKTLNKTFPASVEIQRRTDYVTRVYQNPGSTAELKSTFLAEKLGERFDEYAGKYVDCYRGIMRRVGIWNMSGTWATKLTDYVVILYAAFGLLTGRVESVGVFATLIAAAAALSASLSPLSMFSGLLVQIQQMAGFLRGFFELDSPIENSMGERISTGAHSLEFRHVDFSYPNSDFAMKNLHFSVAPGEHIAIVGENGAGKTTMMKLLLRLYDVNNGEILIDGQPLSHYDVRTLRRSIGVAFQESHDYAMSLRENLELYGNKPDDTLREALRRAGLERLEDALDTDLTKEFDENGSGLSGGEKQKLALARLFCTDFGLILLDEPSAALDPLAEYELMQSLMTLAEGKTVVMVAHRLSTVRHMDRILVMNHGALVEEGTHEELMAQNGIYAEMFRKQGENYVD